MEKRFFFVFFKDGDPDMIRIGILGSGSKGNSMIISHGKEALLVDAGFSRKELLRRLEKLEFDPGSIRCVLLTHEHTDHLSGAPVFCDALNIPLCDAGSVLAMKKRKNARLPRQLWSFEPGEEFQLGAFKIASFSVQHDAIDPVGFVINCGGIRIGIATDLGEVGPMVRRHLTNCEVLVLESNYDVDMLRNSDRALSLKNRIDGRHGHLDNRAAAAALENLLGDRSKLLLLAHRSSECNTPELVHEGVLKTLTRLNRSYLPFAVLSQENCLQVSRQPGGEFEFSELE